MAPLTPLEAKKTYLFGMSPEGRIVALLVGQVGEIARIRQSLIRSDLKPDSLRKRGTRAREQSHASPTDEKISNCIQHSRFDATGHRRER